MSSLLVLSRVYRLESCWYFRPSFVNYCPPNLLWLTSPTPPPLPRVKVQYGGGGC
jgi:hypothetical protein